jgi:hypothetical protein
MDSGYMVEGDIFLHVNVLDKKISSTTLRIANVEQYRTTNTITPLPKAIDLYICCLPQVYKDALDIAAANRPFNTNDIIALNTVY